MGARLSQDTHQNVNEWIKQLSETDMPVFSTTVSEVTDAINNEKSSAVDVAQLVLRDASLTGRLLKVANTVYFNPSQQRINTVSRAIMVLGFDKVRELTLSLLLVDSLVKGENRAKLVESMATAFHAAIQAQELAKKRDIKNVEDIFVATLLADIGDMAFWAFSHEQAEALLAAVNEGETQAVAERQVLGFTLKDLSKGLCKSWSLGELLEDFLSGKSTDPRIMLIEQGKKLAQATQSGWQSEAATTAIREIASSLKLDIKEVEALTFANAQKARDITRLYGSHEASQKIPQPDYSLIDDELVQQAQDAQNAIDEIASLAVSAYPQPDPSYQMTVMQEITNTVQERPSIGIILEMVLEGIHRGVGMDRAVFMILNPERTHLICKYALGEGSELIRKQLEVDVRRPENIFNKIIQSQKALMLPADPAELNGTISVHTLDLLGKPPYIVMPTIVKSKVIGLFIADRNASGREINDQDFLAFQQFCQQANMGLSFLAMRG